MSFYRLYRLYGWFYGHGTYLYPQRTHCLRRARVLSRAGWGAATVRSEWVRQIELAASDGGYIAASNRSGFLARDAITEDPETYYSNMHYVGHLDAVKQALTVRENLAFHCALRPSAPNIERALDHTGLAALADLPARMLSAGQTRRLALARMLASPSPLWLLDEPTVGLDIKSVERLFAAISDHRAGGGMVVASTNVPLGIDDAVTIDTSVFAKGNETLWGGAGVTEPTSGDRV